MNDNIPVGENPGRSLPALFVCEECGCDFDCVPDDGLCKCRHWQAYNRLCGGTVREYTPEEYSPEPECDPE